MKAKVSFSKSAFWQKNGHLILIYLFTAAMIVTASVLDKDFLTIRNINNVILSTLPILIVSLGQMCIILSGGIDLSLGSIVSLCNVVCVFFMKPAEPLGYVLAIVMSLFAGAVCGVINGLLITKGRLTPVITTITTMTIFAGIAMYIQPIPGGKVHGAFSKFMLGKLDFATPIVMLIIFVILIRVLTTNTAFGKKLRAIGGNEDAAYVTGINVSFVKICAYAIAGLCAAVAGIFLTASMRCGDATVGSSYTMNSITAAVVGGTLLSGSVGDALGAVAGAFMLMIINNILNLVGVSSFYQYVFQGAILIFALAISSLRSNKRCTL